MSDKTKYIFITGGVVSSVGKGVAVASIGALLQSRGYSVHARKFDPYLNMNPGKMSPMQHGEIYVTDDGFETDLDLGYYERFLGIKLSKNDSVSGGRIYWEVLNADRCGNYPDATVQMIPHVSDKIKEHFATPVNADFVLCEIGGTVGDIEGLIFLEAARQFANEVGRRNAMFVHLTLAPFVQSANELKTKPTQQSVRILLEKGIQADMLVVRTPRILDDDERKKIAMFCNLSPDFVISGIDMDNIYKIPLEYERQGVTKSILSRLEMFDSGGDMSRFQKIADYLAADLPTINVALVENPFESRDIYKSLFEALFHAGIQNNVRVKTNKIDAKRLGAMPYEELCATFANMNGILVPSGFNGGGIDGKVSAARFARENKIPYLGLGQGMHAAVIEFMRNICGVKDANSAEFADKCTPVARLLENNTLCLGAHPFVIKNDSLAHKIYDTEKRDGRTPQISERYRHRYGLDPEFQQTLAANGMIVSGWGADKNLPEIVEIPGHPFFLGCQFNPEFQSSPYTGHPLFTAFIKSATNAR